MFRVDCLWTPHVMRRLVSDHPSHLAQAVGYTNESDVQSLFARADLDGSGDIDYPEYERLMNMERLGDEFVSVPPARHIAGTCKFVLVLATFMKAFFFFFFQLVFPTFREDVAGSCHLL